MSSILLCFTSMSAILCIFSFDLSRNENTYFICHKNKCAYFEMPNITCTMAGNNSSNMCVTTVNDANVELDGYSLPVYGLADGTFCNLHIPALTCICLSFMCATGYVRHFKICTLVLKFRFSVILFDWKTTSLSEHSHVRVSSSIICAIIMSLSTVLVYYNLLFIFLKTSLLFLVNKTKNFHMTYEICVFISWKIKTENVKYCRHRSKKIHRCII
jgi:hypothetical protein